ncbi:MAG: 30S ribosomal protein S24e [Candidatus Diapherotrites archaeon]|nr:30S ribosomal protein S24e [Candidatus Diapherotrites archaeon]
MKVNFIEEKNNLLLGRKEIQFEIEEMNTVPSRSEVCKKISSLKGAEEGLTVIEKIGHYFGRKKITGFAKIYSSKEALQKIEQEHILDRHLPKAERKQKQEQKKAAAATTKKSK